MAAKKTAKKEKKDITPITIADEKDSALKNALSEIEKKYGKGAVMKMGEKLNLDIPVVTTGIISIDVALGVGGVPKGRIIEVYGPESSGKTTLALHIVSEVQKAGGIAGYIDAEHAMDPNYAKKLGVNIDELYISQPDNGEQALEITEAMVRSCAVDVVVVDSVAALVPKSEIEGEMGQATMGVQARLMSQALRKLTAITSKTNCIVIFINQLRDKIGISYGPSETTTGGRALKFYSSIRIEIKRIADISEGDMQTGVRTRVTVKKNKVAPPFRTCEVDIMFGVGISREGDLIDLGVKLEIIKKSGSWYSYNETRLGQGKETAKQYLVDNPELKTIIENAARLHYGMKSLEDLKSEENFVKVTPEELDSLDIDVLEDEDLLLED